MSKRNVARMNTYLKKGMKLADVSKHLKIEVNTLKRFMAKPKEAPKVETKTKPETK